jgi:Prolyl oligopeptidase family
MVSASFDIGWHAYLACSLQYVIVSVDGRGTGFKGRALRNPVKGNLGFWETQDQINAARSVPILLIATWIVLSERTSFNVFVRPPPAARRRQHLGIEGLR